MAPKVNTCIDSEPSHPGCYELLDELQQQLGDDRQIAEVHDADIEPAQRQLRLPEDEATTQQERQQQCQPRCNRRVGSRPRTRAARPAA
jgi:hypothetical protein